jgi:hypothetical protein
MQEDEKLQDLDKKKEGLNTAEHDLKKNQKTMTISDKLRSAQELKSLHAELRPFKQRSSQGRLSLSHYRNMQRRC